jgi:predicted HicB family RNase H-like nuclease
MGRNSSYHLTQIETDMNIPSANQQSEPEGDRSVYRSMDSVMEMKGYRLEVPSEQRSEEIVGQIRSPRGRLVSNFSPKGNTLDELRTQFVGYVDDLLSKIEAKFRDDLAHEKIQGKIALRINPELHCNLKIESTFKDTTLNSYIEEIAAQRIPFDRPSPPLKDHGASESNLADITPEPRPQTKTDVATPQSDISRKLRQSPLAWTRMMSSLVVLAKKDESSDIVTFSEALGRLINTLGSGIDQLSPYLDINEGDEASLLEAIGKMLLEASDALK